MKRAIIYDWLDKTGGAERLLSSLARTFPDADWYTSVYDETKNTWLQKHNVTPSFMQRIPFAFRKHRILMLPLYAYAFEMFDFSQYDSVISVSSTFAKGIITKPSTHHTAIILTPPRYLWTHLPVYAPWSRIAGDWARNTMRTWDYIASQRPDTMIGISETVVQRINTFYRRHAEVVFPPFQLEYWKKIASMKPINLSVNDYYLVVSRLEPYKRIELAIEACMSLGKTIVVVGEGSQKSRLMKRYMSDRVVFQHTVSDTELAYLYRHAQALLMPQEEDFGYTALEALSCGCPVITYAYGGGAEIVTDMKTGIHIYEQSVPALRAGLEKYEAVSYNITSYIRTIGTRYFDKFSEEEFAQKLTSLIH